MAIPPWASLTVDEKRTRTLAVADDLFAREGLDVAMPVLAAAVGAGVGSIYRQVGAKEDVIDALVIAQAQALVQRFSAALEEDDAWAALERATVAARRRHPRGPAARLQVHPRGGPARSRRRPPARRARPPRHAPNLKR